MAQVLSLVGRHTLHNPPPNKYHLHQQNAYGHLNMKRQSFFGQRETKRKLKVRVKEHRTETERVSKGAVYTWDRKRQSQSEMWCSALTDHALKENHIDWESAKIIDKEQEDQARGIKEAIHIRKVPNLNRHEGRYHLSYLLDDLLGAARRR